MDSTRLPFDQARGPRQPNLPQRPRFLGAVEGALPPIIGLKVYSHYALVEQQSDALPSARVNVNHICFPTLLFQMASVIALFLLQMLLRLRSAASSGVDKALQGLMGK